MIWKWNEYARDDTVLRATRATHGPRSTLGDATERRDWRIWVDLAAVLIRRANKLYADAPLGLDVIPFPNHSCLGVELQTVLTHGKARQQRHG